MTKKELTRLKRKLESMLRLVETLRDLSKEWEERKGGEVMNKQIEVLEMIMKDMKNDAKCFDGRPFNGKTVGKYFENQEEDCLTSAIRSAAIAALANIVKAILEKEG